MKTRRNRLIEFILVVSIIVIISCVLYFIGAEQIVAYVGVENTYLVLFFIALFGGMTSVGGTSYIASILTFVSGGADPMLVAVAAGLGTGIGDTVYFLAAKKGNKVLSEGRIKHWTESFTAWLRSHGEAFKFFVIYLYVGFTPLPNDPLTIALGFGNARKKVVIPALFLGDTTLALLLALFGNNLPFIG